MNAIESSTSARVDLKDTPLDGGEHLYIDGSCSMSSDGVYLCRYAIVTEEGERVEAYRLNHNSAQAVEIINIMSFKSHDASLRLVFVLPDLLKTSFTTSNIYF